MYEVVALDEVACWLLYEIQANCFVVRSLGHRVLRGAEWSQINVAICHRRSPTPPHAHAHTHTNMRTAQRDPQPCVALKVALQWPLCWSMKGNLYSGGYWQYFHDISHSKLHSVPCNKSHYFTCASKGFHTVSVIASAPEEEFIKLRLTPLRSPTTCTRWGEAFVLYLGGCGGGAARKNELLRKGWKERWSANIQDKCNDTLDVHHLLSSPFGPFTEFCSHQ